MNGIVGLVSNRGNAPNGQPYALEDLTVEGNTITQGTGTAAGIAIDGSGISNSVYTSMNNTFRNNTYHLPNGGGDYFVLDGRAHDLGKFSSLFLRPRKSWNSRNR